MDNVRQMRPRQPRQPRKPGPPSRRRVIIAVVVAVIVVLLVVISRLMGYYVDWLWFGEVGFRSVFWTRIVWHLIVGAAAFVVFFVIVAFNVELARRLAPSFRVSEHGELLEPRSDAVKRYVGWGGLAVAALAALFAGISASTQWQTFLLYFKQAPFGQKDAIFGHDVGFYVFSLPMWQAVQAFVFGALIAALVFAAIVHLLMGGIELQGAGRRRRRCRRRRRAPRRPARPRRSARAQRAARAADARRSTSSSAAAPWPTSAASSRRSSWSSASASSSAAGACCTPRPAPSTAPATPTCTSACRSPT